MLHSVSKFNFDPHIEFLIEHGHFVDIIKLTLKEISNEDSDSEIKYLFDLVLQIYEAIEHSLEKKHIEKRGTVYDLTLKKLNGLRDNDDKNKCKKKITNSLF